MRRSQLEAFAASVFIGGDETSEDHVVEQSLNGNSYLVIGYSASRSQVKVFHGDRHIKQASFQFTGLGEPIETYQREALDPGGHLIVEFDRENLRFNGRSFVGPKVQGVSGGGVFHLADRSVAQRSTLVAIATQHRRRSRLIVGTRIEHFMRIARDLIATERSLFD